nr:RNA-directed DNA polymerase, eukaryota, reverse transcriptase zinc-binding domain protein [Tanacetum cinerariifolium]
LKYPPGFTPNEKGDIPVEKVDNWSDENRVNDGQEDGVCVGQHVHERVEVLNDTHESTCYGHFKKSKVPHKGGFILELIDDLVNVGQTMGYDMTGIPKGGNSSFITLITKVPNANMVKDFRPISLIGSLYKVFAKVLKNHLVTVLDDIVDEIHSAFVTDRQILEGRFILNKIVHWCKNKKKQSMIFKVDFEKAYDSSQCNINTIIRVLDVFYRTSGLRINMNKSNLMGISMDSNKVKHAAVKIGTIPIYHMSIFKVPIKKPSWVRWKSVLAAKDVGSLGVSSLFPSNRALMFKGVWRFFFQKNSLWVRVVKALHGEDGKTGKKVQPRYPSTWLNIINEIESLKLHGIDLVSFITIKLGNGANTSFWDVAWCGDIAFKNLVPRLYALESMKNIEVASKLSHGGLEFSYRRNPRGGVKQAQFERLKEMVEGVTLSNSNNRWSWSLVGSSDFSVSSVRKLIDNAILPKGILKTRWIKEVPIKINVHAWKVIHDCLPTRFNISRRVALYGLFSELDTSTEAMEPTKFWSVLRSISSEFRRKSHGTFLQQ